MKQDSINIKVSNGIKEDFESCGKCKYRKLPSESCKVAGCIHAWKNMKDLYEYDKETENE